MATAITCGEGGSTGAEWAARINALSQVDPRVSLTTVGSVTQTLTDAAEPIVINAFNTVETERAGFLGDVATNSISNGNTEDFVSTMLNISINAGFEGNEEIEFFLYADGVLASTNPIHLYGAGGTGQTDKPVVLNWTADFIFQAGAVIDIRARAASTATMDVTWLSSSLIANADWKDNLA